MAPCRCLRHNMSTRRAGRSQTSCKSLRLAAAGQRGRKGWGTKPPWSSGAAPLSSPPRPGREPSGCQRPKRRFAAAGWSTKPPRRYCSRHSHPRHQCGRSQVPPGRSARPGLHLLAARRGARSGAGIHTSSPARCRPCAWGRDGGSRGDPHRPLHFLSRLSGRRLDGRALLRFPGR